MSVQATIIGLGQIGASIGLALGEHKDLVTRTGHDRSLEIARRAEKMGAVDNVSLNLPASVQQADVVILALPLDQIRETMAIIAPDLKEGAVVMDTGPVKEVVSAWAGEMLPEGRFYVGLTPVINPAYLHGADSGLEAAHADLFKKGLIAIVAPPRAPSEAIKLAADMARLLGADPLFFDPVELDSLMGSTHILPQLMAAALVNATVDQPGWREARKIAGRAYAEVTGPIVQFSEPSSLVSAAIMNRENILRAMDSLIAVMETLRNDISQADNAALQSRLERAQRGRERWWHERTDANWIAEEVSGTTSADAAPSGEVLRRLMGLGKWPKPKKRE